MLPPMAVQRGHIDNFAVTWRMLLKLHQRRFRCPFGRFFLPKDSTSSVGFLSVFNSTSHSPKMQVSFRLGHRKIRQRRTYRPSPTSGGHDKKAVARKQWNWNSQAKSIYCKLLKENYQNTVNHRWKIWNRYKRRREIKGYRCVQTS